MNRKEEKAVAIDEKDESHSMLKFRPSIEDSDVPRSQQPIQSLPAAQTLTSALNPIVRCRFHDGVVVSKVFQIPSPTSMPLPLVLIEYCALQGEKGY